MSDDPSPVPACEVPGAVALAGTPAGSGPAFSRFCLLARLFSTPKWLRALGTREVEGEGGFAQIALHSWVVVVVEVGVVPFWELSLSEIESRESSLSEVGCEIVFRYIVFHIYSHE